MMPKYIYRVFTIILINMVVYLDWLDINWWYLLALHVVSFFLLFGLIRDIRFLLRNPHLYDTREWIEWDDPRLYEDNQASQVQK